MEEADGKWILHGVQKDDPQCIRTIEELIAYIDQMGFVPLFRNEIPGFSVEEHTVSEDWWSGNIERDPWEWRALIARSGKIAYGKFFGKKAGFISKEWIPYFANYRRNGYDFDALWEDKKASRISKKIMDLFSEDTELFSFEMKRQTGFGKNGEKNFEGVISNLQMQTYLCVRDFRKKKSKEGKEYGWAVAVYAMPERIWGYDYVTSSYGETPQESYARLQNNIASKFPDIEITQIERLLGLGKTKNGREKKKE